MVCLRNICINTLHKGDNDDDDNDDNNNNNNNNNNNMLIIIFIAIHHFNCYLQVLSTCSSSACLSSHNCEMTRYLPDIQLYQYVANSSTNSHFLKRQFGAPFKFFGKSSCCIYLVIFSFMDFKTLSEFQLWGHITLAFKTRGWVVEEIF